MDWTTWCCVRHGLDYLVLCSLCKSAAAIKINLCLFIFSLDLFLLAQCHNVFADPCFALHMRKLFWPTGSDSVSSCSAGRLHRSAKSDCNFLRPAFCLCHDQSQPVSIPASPLDHYPTNCLCHEQSATVDPGLALRLVSAMIGASSFQFIPHNLIPHSPLVSGNWASGFITPVSILAEVGGGSNA